MTLTLLRKLTKGFGAGKDEDGRWLTPVALDRGPVGEFCFGMDRHGRGQAMWENQGKLWTQSFGPGMPPALGRHPVGDGRAPRIAVNLEGRGVAVWIEEGFTNRQILGLPFDPTTSSRSHSRVLFQTFGKIHDLQVVVDRRGGAQVVWSHEIDGQWEILAKSFDVRAKAWEHDPTRLGPRVEHPLAPRLGMNRRGQAVVLWAAQADRADGLVAANYLPTEKLWSDQPVTIAEGTTKEVQVAVDHAGNVMALWVSQPYGHRPTLFARLYATMNGRWEAPEVLATAAGFRQVRLCMTGTGEALAVWLQNEGSALSFLHSKAYKGGSWEERVVRLDSETGKVDEFSMVLGPKGQAGLLCLVRGHDGRIPMVRSRGREWRPPVAVAPRTERLQTRPELSLCPSGSVALWKQGEGSDTLLVMAMQT